MKNFVPTVLLMLFSFFSYSYAQTQLIDSFEATNTDTTYHVLVEGASTLDYSVDPSTKIDGTNSLRIKTKIAGGIHDWGSFSQLQRRLPAETYYDFSTNDTLSLWIKVVQPPAGPANVVFRIHIGDQPTPDDNIEEYIYENATILDAATDWVQLKVPLKERTAESGNPDETGFILFPANWSRSAAQENNKKLDYDKIVMFNISFITTTGAADSVTYNIDKFEATGIKAVPVVLFNGIQFPPIASLFTWGLSTVAIEEGTGPVTGSNAIKWIQGNDNSGWTGWGLNLSPNQNMLGAWQKDSLKFKMKCEPGVGQLRAQFEAGGVVGKVFTPKTDNEWHTYALALKDMVKQDAVNKPDPFNAAAVNVFQFLTEGSANSGKVVYISDLWTGTPSFDVIAPAAPKNIAAITGSYQNLVTWTDVPGESGETYDVYFSKNKITDITAKGVDVVKLDVVEGAQLMEHILRAPVTDQEVTYYYAVVCRDAGGNLSKVSASSAAITNTAKGVPTVSLSAPAFNADGDLSEWQGITPIRMSPSDGTAFPAPNSTFSGASDLTVKAYIAADNTYLYVAFNVDDDVVSTDVSTNDYENDSPDLFIGLYDYRGRPHRSYLRGAQPDYHFRFSKNKVRIDGGGMARADSVLLPGADYYWNEKFPSGYVVEARISLQALADRGPDSKFTPADGMRIPIDFSINDADGAVREGILCYSPYNADHSYETPMRWLNTWIGTGWDPAVSVADNEQTVNTYNLMQNYPNPFNPSTFISYSIKQEGLVTLKIYDMLGREVAVLVNGSQNAGTHVVPFNASSLSSGIYFYKVESGNFQAIKKMMLIK